MVTLAFIVAPSDFFPPPSPFPNGLGDLANHYDAQHDHEAD
jgi:hypothetical protein